MRSKKSSASLTIVSAILVVTLMAATHGLTQEKVLHNFGNGEDGSEPYAGLVFDSSGNLFGTTYVGGTHGFGTLFEMSPTVSGGWTERVLLNLNQEAPGYHSFDSLILDGSSNLYGTNFEGGTTGGGNSFELRRWPKGGWTEKILCDFGGHVDNTENGTLPMASLTFDSAGNLYGTTHSGGPTPDGSVFELMPATDGTWTESVLHFFAQGPADGFGPTSNLIFDSSGNLYGTTEYGGAHSFGTVFKLSPGTDGTWTETLLYSFLKKEGQNPWGGLIFDSSGNLYGTTQAGGAYAGNALSGTVYELSPNGDGTWSEKVLHSFGNGTDGAQPMAGLVADPAGNLYGTTFRGGANSAGTVFKLTPVGDGTWTEKIVHSFGKGTDGSTPFHSSLIFDSAGNLYGTTSAGGKYGAGTVFRIMNP